MSSNHPPETPDRQIRAAFQRMDGRVAAHVDTARRFTQIKEPSAMFRTILRPALAGATVLVLALGAVLLLGPFGDGEPVAGSTTTPVESTTSTTLPVTTPSNGTWTDARYRVVGVGGSEAVSVHAQPDPASAVIADLPSGSRIGLESWPVDVDGSTWYGVAVTDGTIGFVNGAYLAPPAEWTTDFATLPCGAEEGFTTGTARGPDPGPGSDAGGYVLDVLRYSGSECDRYVLVFGSASVRGQLGDLAEVAAAAWPANTGLSVSGSVIGVGLPDIASATPRAQTVEGNGSFALATRETSAAICNQFGMPCTGDQPAITMRFFFESNRRAQLTFLNNPGRIVLDVKSAPTGTGLDVAARRAANAVVLPIQSDVNGPGVATPISVSGWARPFEASGVAILRTAADAPGTGAPVEATFSSETGGPGSVRTSTFPFQTNDYTEAWGSFGFSIDDLAPGTYELFVGELSPRDGTEEGVYQEFTVGS